MHWAAARGKLATVALLASHRVDVTVVSHATQAVPSKTAADLLLRKAFWASLHSWERRSFNRLSGKLNTRSQHSMSQLNTDLL